MLMQNCTGPASIIGHHLWISAPKLVSLLRLYNKRIIEYGHDKFFKQQEFFEISPDFFFDSSLIRSYRKLIFFFQKLHTRIISLTFVLRITDEGIRV